MIDNFDKFANTLSLNESLYEINLEGVDWSHHKYADTFNVDVKLNIKDSDPCIYLSFSQRTPCLFAVFNRQYGFLNEWPTSAQRQAKDIVDELSEKVDEKYLSLLKEIGDMTKKAVDDVLKLEKKHYYEVKKYGL